MNEEEYQSLVVFKGLPLYNDDDSRCESIDKVNHDTDFTGEVLEADFLSLAQDYLAREDIGPKRGYSAPRG